MSDVLETHSASVEEEGSEILRVNQYTLHGKLGEGAYGVVLECEDDKNHKFAIKYVSKSLLKRQKEYTKVGRKMTITTAFDDVKKEIAVMKKLHHPKLVRLIEVVDDPDNDKLFMVMELVNGGQVMEWNKDTKGFTANPRLRKPGGTGHEMSEESARLVLRDVLLGLDYLHSSHVVHRDLKPQNLLLTGDMERICVKIADFGVSHVFETLEQGDSTNSEPEKLTKVKGTYPFYAPECLEPIAFDGYKADIWALGINIYCFLTGRLPFYDEIPPTMFDMIASNPIDFDIMIKNFSCSPAVVHFTTRLLDKNPDRRPANAHAVIELHDPWLGDFLNEENMGMHSALEVTEAEISAAFTPIDLDLYTVANLKIFAQKWRRRAASSAMKRKEEEIRRSLLDTQSSGTLSVTTKSMEELLPPTSKASVEEQLKFQSKASPRSGGVEKDVVVSKLSQQLVPSSGAAPVPPSIAVGNGEPSSQNVPNAADAKPNLRRQSGMAKFKACIVS